MERESNSNLQKILIKLVGRQRAQEVSDVLAIDEDLDAEAGAKVSRAVIAQALNMLLFADLIERVPAAKRYVAHCLAHQSTVMHDHGAVRTIALDGMGALPAGASAITRILQPLGYSLRSVYPLERLKMTGYSHAQVDYPEAIAQFFVSELHPEKFTPAFQAALERVTSTTADPLTHEANALLNDLESSHSLSLDQAVALLPVLVSCFDRHHGEIFFADYAVLLNESAEAAWISTEGNAFNHVTDRVQDVDALSDQQKALGEPMKETVERSQSGRVRQTAFRAAQVSRSFLAENGTFVQKDVPGSFLEFITRLPLPDEVGGKTVLDLGFDSSNAQAIFKMTANPSL